MDIIQKTRQIQPKFQEAPKKTRSAVFDKIIKLSIFSLVFLIPLFFLPFSYEKIEYNKQILLWALSGIAFLAWIARMVFADKEIRFKKDLLSAAVLAFVAINAAVLIFSNNFYSSLWGRFGRYSDSFIGLLACAALFFVIHNNSRIFIKSDKSGAAGAKKIPLLNIFLLSAFISEIIIIGSAEISAFGKTFGLWSGILGNSQAYRMFSAIGFNTLASFKEGAAIFLSLILFAAALKIFSGKGGRKIARIFNYALLATSFLSLFILTFKPAWILMIIVMILWTFFSVYGRFKEKSSNPSNIILPLAIIIALSLLLSLIAGPENFKLKLRHFEASEARLSAKDSLRLAGKSIKENFAFGAGQGNFGYVFSKFKTEEFLKSKWGLLRFNKSHNYIAELIATTGLFGIIGYLFLLSAAFYKKKLQLSSLLLLSAILSQFFYSSTTVLLFSFWLFLSIHAIQSSEGESEFYAKNIFQKIPEILIALNASFAALAIFFAIFLIGIGKKYRANMLYAKTASSDASVRNVEILEKAENLDPKNSLYPIALARIYIADLNNEFKKAPSEQIISKISDLAKKAMEEAKTAADLAPLDISAWELLGSVYRDVYPAAGGAEKAMFEAFKKAVELEPANLILLTELGKAYMLNGDNLKAQENFNKALGLSEYEEAKIQLAIAKDKAGNADEAIAEMELLAERNPEEARLKFELGRMLYNSGKIDEAMKNFQSAIQISPDYSNPLYSLALCYLKKEDKNKALIYFKKVLTLNPGNSDVAAKIEDLEGNSDTGNQN